MFGKKKATVHDTARAALRDTAFPCAAGDLPSIVVDYEPSVWVRTPRPGEDREQWVTQHADAWAADLGTSDAYRAGLDAAADRLVTHTVDLLALPQPEREVKTMVLSIDILDDELGMLEHGEPAAFLAFGDVAPGARVPTTLFGLKKDKDAFTYSMLSDPAPEPGMPGRLLRAHRLISPGVHLYALGIFDDPENIRYLLRTINTVRRA